MLGPWTCVTDSTQSEKWFIPRNPVMNAALAGTIGDRWGILARILEFCIRLFFYRDMWEMAPPAFGADGIYDGTPVVNSRIFQLIVSQSALVASKRLSLTCCSERVAQAGFVATSNHSRPRASNSLDGPAGRLKAPWASSA